jgi:cytosine/adenosine deaminase-related metal-dependent hydrolase
VSDVFRLATIDGAHCLGMGHLLGSIERGKKADLILIDNQSPTALGTARDQSAAAIVLHANVGDIRWVIVDGQVKKKHGKLVLDQSQSWAEITTELETSRNRLMKSFDEKFSAGEIEELKIKATHILGIKDILED